MKVKNVSSKLPEKMFKVVLEMCSARAYNIESVVYDPNNPDSAQNEYIIASDGKQRIYIFLRLVVPTLALEVFNSMIRTVIGQRITHTVIFYDKKTSSVKETDQEINVELIEIDRIHFNPNAHVLSPVYRKLSLEEIHEFKKQGNVLQIMQGKDAIAVFNGYRKNDIIEIKRSNGYIDYRIVKGIAYKLIELSDSESEGDEEAEGDEEGEEGDEEEDEEYEGEDEEESDEYEYE